VNDSAARSTLILDRQPLWVSALQHVLERSGFSVVAATTSEPRALQLLREHRPAALVFEPEACVSAPTRFLEVVRAEHPGLRIVAISGSDEAQNIGEYLSSGVAAYVLKRAHPDDISMAVRQSFERSVHLAPQRSDDSLLAFAPHRVLPDEEAGDLTRREREILALVAEGSSNGAVAKRLWVTEQTVKFHLSNIYRKLGVSNRTAASRWAHQHGVVNAGRALVAV
jgi:DNA-binding NarL/FixJ family response regulator